MKDLSDVLTESQQAEICSVLAQLIEAANKMQTE
jgi:hypothetical protein